MSVIVERDMSYYDEALLSVGHGGCQTRHWSQFTSTYIKKTLQVRT